MAGYQGEKGHWELMKVPYPDKHILTWRFMGVGIKVGKEHWELMSVSIP
jgi:hypothetical protein